MRTLIFLLFSINSFCQIKPVVGISGAIGSYPIHMNLEAGIIKERIMLLGNSTYYISDNIISYGLKVGCIAIYNDVEENDVIYIVGGISSYTYKEEKNIRKITPTIGIRWHYYKSAFETGLRDSGFYIQAGFQFRKIN